jgi:hypothetical protein
MRFHTASFKQWLEHQQKLKSKIVFLEEAIFDNQIGKYAWHRLRFFLFGQILFLLVHWVEFTYLKRFFFGFILSDLLLIRFLLQLASEFWWGGLESMRGEIQKAYQNKDRTGVEALISAWTRKSVGVAALALVCCGILFAISYSISGRFTLAQFYLIGCFLRFILEVFSRTLYSGAYALIRVHRNMASIIAPHLFSVLVIPLCWGWLGFWSIGLIPIMGALISFGFSIYFTQKTFNMLRIKIPLKAFLRFDRSQFYLKPGVKSFLWAGMGFILIRLDTFYFVTHALKNITSLPQGRVSWAFYYLSYPLIAITTDWVRFFYFDLKKLIRHEEHPFFMRFSKLLDRFSIMQGGFTWIIFFGFYLVYARHASWTIALSAPIFLLRSYLSASQIKAFVRGQYTALLLTTSILLGTLFTLAHTDSTPAVNLFTLCFVFWVTRIYLSAEVSRPRIKAGSLEILPLNAWIRALAHHTGPTRIGTLSFWNTKGARNPTRRGAQHLIQQMKGEATFAIVGQHRLVWFQNPANPTPLLNPGPLTLEFPGLLSEALFRPEFPKSQDSFMDAVDSGVFGRERKSTHALHSTDLPIGIDTLRTEFTKTFPKGFILSLESSTDPSLIRQFTADEKCDIIRQAFGYSREYKKKSRNSDWVVTTYSPEGQTRLIFITEKIQNQEAHQDWNKKLKNLNWQNSISTAFVSLPHQ